MDSARPVSSITVENTGDENVLVQSSTMRWLQPTGVQDLAETNDIIVSPPIFELEPGKSQIVRIAHESSEPVSEELTYRLFLSEVPIDGYNKADSSGVKIALRMSLPIFITPEKAEPQFNAYLHKNCESEMAAKLKVLNSGTRHAMMLKMALLEQAAEDPFEEVNHPAYLLTDSMKVWNLSQEYFAGAPAPKHLELSYTTVDGLTGRVPVNHSDDCMPQ